jgi:chromosome segregation ATPase
MFGIGKSVLRFGLIGALVLGGATLVVGKDRVVNGLGLMRDRAVLAIDTAMEDPVAMRRQLENLAGEYPKRIARVERELSEVDRHLSLFESDIERAERVIAITSDDLSRLSSLVERARAEREAHARPVVIRFDGTRYDVDAAYAEGRRIASVRDTTRDRLEQNRFQVSFLLEQRERLADVHDRLQKEYDSYQAQLWALDRQIDAIQRNERLIELTEAQQATLESFDKLGRIQNLGQLESRLSQMRTEQEARLQQLARRGIRQSYEERAAMELGRTPSGRPDPFAEPIEFSSPRKSAPSGDSVVEIEITEEDSVKLAGS